MPSSLPSLLPTARMSLHARRHSRHTRPHLPPPTSHGLASASPLTLLTVQLHSSSALHTYVRARHAFLESRAASQQPDPEAQQRRRRPRLAHWQSARSFLIASQHLFASSRRTHIRSRGGLGELRPSRGGRLGPGFFWTAGVGGFVAGRRGWGCLSMERRRGERETYA